MVVVVFGDDRGSRNEGFERGKVWESEVVLLRRFLCLPSTNEIELVLESSPRDDAGESRRRE